MQGKPPLNKRLFLSQQLSLCLLWLSIYSPFTPRIVLFVCLSVTSLLHHLMNEHVRVWCSRIWRACLSDEWGHGSLGLSSKDTKDKLEWPPTRSWARRAPYTSWKHSQKITLKEICLWISFLLATISSLFGFVLCLSEPAFLLRQRAVS